MAARRAHCHRERRRPLARRRALHVSPDAHERAFRAPRHFHGVPHPVREPGAHWLGLGPAAGFGALLGRRLPHRLDRGVASSGPRPAVRGRRRRPPRLHPEANQAGPRRAKHRRRRPDRDAPRRAGGARGAAHLSLRRRVHRAFRIPLRGELPAGESLHGRGSRAQGDLRNGGGRHGQYLGRDPGRPPRRPDRDLRDLRARCARGGRLRLWRAAGDPLRATHGTPRRREPPGTDVMSGYVESVLVLLAINTVLAYGAFLPMSAGQLNLGVAAFVAIGAYSGGYLSNAFHLHPVAAALAASLFTGAFGFVVAFPILRTRGIYLALATFALNQVVQGILLNLDAVGGAAGYPVSAHIGFPLVATFALTGVGLVLLLFHTRFGISVTAVKDDERAADVMGLSVRGLQSAAFTAG